MIIECSFSLCSQLQDSSFCCMTELFDFTRLRVLLSRVPVDPDLECIDSRWTEPLADGPEIVLSVRSGERLSRGWCDVRTSERTRLTGLDLADAIKIDASTDIIWPLVLTVSDDRALVTLIDIRPDQPMRRADRLECLLSGLCIRTRSKDDGPLRRFIEIRIRDIEIPAFVVPIV